MQRLRDTNRATLHRWSAHYLLVFDRKLLALSLCVEQGHAYLKRIMLFHACVPINVATGAGSQRSFSLL